MADIKKALRKFISTANKENFAGKASEESYYPALKTLIESTADNVHAIILERGESDKPDFAVYRGNARIGIIEVKFPSIDILQIEDDARRGIDNPNTIQFRKYTESRENVFYTNLLDWRLYRNGEFRGDSKIARIGMDGEFHLVTSEISEFENRVSSFLAAAPLSVDTAESLALEMARLTKLIRDETVKLYKKGDKFLIALFNVFKSELVLKLTIDDFADMYAQTIAYGLFTAKIMITEDTSFSRKVASEQLPKTNPFLRRVFKDLIDDDNMPESLKQDADDMVSVIKEANMNEIIKSIQEYRKRTYKCDKIKTDKDPIIYFYEPFLAAYDPDKRESRGVYYTPLSVVSYIVRSVDELLISEFGFDNGLADDRVIILDPACGTGTFLHEVLRLIYNKIITRGKAYWRQYVPRLLQRLFGFELLMAPYTIAHLKLAQFLKDETGYEFNDNQRLGIFLTNTLCEAEKHSFPLLQQLEYWIINEQNLASDVKAEKKVVVVLGNPPYSGHSMNPNIHWMENILKIGYNLSNKTNRHGYYSVDDHPLDEKNTKWLQNDYVKFLRWAQWRIDTTGYGITAMVTDHSYLDNPTFRGMRQSLMETYNKIKILDLHGNLRKKEKTPEGGKDENIFDQIQQGVAIGLLIRSKEENTITKGVLKCDSWGLREEKTDYLFKNSNYSTSWEEINPKSPYYLFVPVNETHEKQYLKGWKITNVFRLNNAGIVTARDNLTIGFSEKQIWDVINDFISLDKETAREKYHLGQDVLDWKVELAQKDIKKENGPKKNLIKQILYRPFDFRYTYYTGNSRGFICRPRREIMTHMLFGNNIGLVVGRSGHVTGDNYWDISWVSESIVDFNVFRRGGCNLFPLYLIDNSSRIISDNFNPDFIDVIESIAGNQSSEKIFYYIYAILNSSTYRRRYWDYLLIDFPFIPLPDCIENFEALANEGSNLVKLHLLKNKRSWDWGSITQLGNQNAEPIVGDISYDEKNEELILDIKRKREDRFRIGPIKKQVWEFTVGGYKVLNLWLNERSGKSINLDDFVPIILSLENTNQIVTDKINPIFIKMMKIE